MSKLNRNKARESKHFSHLELAAAIEQIINSMMTLEICVKSTAKLRRGTIDGALPSSVSRKKNAVAFVELTSVHP